MQSLPYLDPNQASPILQALLASSREAMVAETSSGQLVAVNQRFLDLVGWKGAFAGRSLDDLLAAWGSRSHQPHLLEDYFRTSRKDPARAGCRELQPHPGQVLEARCLSFEGSQGERVQLWMLREGRSSALAWVSHEIRNPLNAVLGFSELLTEALTTHESEAVKTSLRGLRVGTKQLQAVLGDLLDLSRLESGVVETRPEWVDLPQFLGDLDTLFRTRHRRRGLEFVIDAPCAECMELWIDPSRLAQILGNLLSNSLRFTKRGWVALRVLRQGEGWEFVVEDSGVGIPHDQQRTIFEPFVQRQGQNSGGTGLGLAICRTLAQGLGGSLGLESEPGHGSRFSLTFPRLKSRSLTGACSDDEAPSPPGEATLLIADDERTNHLLVRGFLRDSEITLWEANDGLQAVELWKAKRPRAILMDLRMPGLSGLEAAKRIRALDPRGSTRLLAMSATKPSEIELAEGRPLWSGYLEKPFSRQDLLKFLSKHLTIVDDSAKSS